MIALITLKEVNTTDVETRENPHEQKIDDELKKKTGKLLKNLTFLFNSLILFHF